MQKTAEYMMSVPRKIKNLRPYHYAELGGLACGGIGIYLLITSPIGVLAGLGIMGIGGAGLTDLSMRMQDKETRERKESRRN